MFHDSQNYMRSNYVSSFLWYGDKVLCLTILYRTSTLILFYPHKQHNPILFAIMVIFRRTENGILYNIFFIGMFSY